MNGILKKALASAMAFSAAANAAENFELVDLGALGGRNSYASAVSASGNVAGCAETAAGEIHAFLHDGSAMHDLGTGGAAGNACALAVNDQGVVAGRAGSGELVIWANGAVTSLGITGNVGGINGSGVVVGTRNSGASTRAFIYQSGAITEIGDPGVRSEATGVNERGAVVGAAGGHAFIYESGTLTDLGTLGGNMSVARGLNSRMEVVGQASNDFGQPTPFIHSGAMRALPGPSYSSAVAINNRGQVVGSGEGVFGYVIEGGNLTRFSEVPAVTARGWRKLVPTGINDRGWIVGTGENAQGDLRAFILKPLGSQKPRRVG